MLPWREPGTDAWHVLVSELMLQQTPVARVLPVYLEWVRRWPTAAHLAAEPSGEAVRAWGRLGYPRRALRLHAAAVALVERHGGAVPPATSTRCSRCPASARTPRGRSPPSRSAQRHAVVDTNVRRVLARAVDGRRRARAALAGPRPRRGRGAAARRRRDRGPLGGGGDGARGAGLHRPRPPLRRLPAAGHLRVAGGRLPRAHRPAAAAPAALRRHRPPGPRPADGGRARGDRTGARVGCWSRSGPTPTQRDRALAGLLADGLLARGPRRRHAARLSRRAPGQHAGAAPS